MWLIYIGPEGVDLPLVEPLTQHYGTPSRTDITRIAVLLFDGDTP